MNAYIIQEFSALDGKWHNVILSSSVNGIYIDPQKARAVYELFQKTATDPNFIRMIICNLAIIKAECNNRKVTFSQQELVY